MGQNVKKYTYCPLTHIIVHFKYNKATRSPEISREQVQNTIFVINILDIDSHCPYLLSGETTFQLTSC